MLQRADLPRHGGRPHLRRLAPLAVALAALVALALFAPWDRGEGGVVERALAAVGDGPILHAITRFSSGTRIELATGRETASVREAELWLDERRERLRIVVRKDGVAIEDVVTLPSALDSDPVFDPFALAGMYRRALEEGHMRSTGSGTLRGRPVEWLESEARGVAFRAAVDPETFRPLLLRASRAGKVVFEMEVVQLESLEERPPELSRPLSGSATSRGASSSISSQATTLAAARSGLFRAALWPGRSVPGAKLTVISLENVEVENENGASASMPALRLGYGPRFAGTQVRYLEIQEAAAVHAARVWRLDGDVAPPPGYIDVTESGIGTRNQEYQTRWSGRLQANGYYVLIESFSRKALLEAARQLRPVTQE